MTMKCSSRFALLKIEDDDYLSDIGESDAPKLKPTSHSCQSQSDSQNKKKSKKKKKTAVDADLQKLAFGSTKVAKSKKGDKSVKLDESLPQQQSANFTKRDEKFVTDAFESDLHEAILQSQLELEQKLVENKSSDVSEDSKNSKKKKKKKTNITLSEFQNLNEDIKEQESIPVVDFFNSIGEVAGEILAREKMPKVPKKVNTEVNETERVRNVQYLDKLKRVEAEAVELRREIKELKAALDASKNKKKQILKILCDSETKDKAELVIQLNELTKVRDDLTDQVQQLHTSLEQERSKVHGLQMEVKKYQSKKKDDGKKS